MEKSRVQIFGRSLSRRAVVLGASIMTASAVLAAGVSRLRRAPASKSFIKAINFSDVRSIGDGYYEASGWVLTKADLEMAGATIPKEAPDVP